MKPFCEHPVVLINPKVEGYVYFWKNCRIIINGKPVKLLASYTAYNPCFYLPKRNGVTPDNYENSFLVNEDTGETIPFFICVPCGRCRICRARKSNELASRCIAETNYWGKAPFFVTFTYNNANLPKKGVQKTDLQLFFKRLRSRLDYFGIEHNIRYYAVAEYGTNTHRAHYHALIWNFPDAPMFPTVLQKIQFLQRSWSTFVFDKDGKRIPKRGSDGVVLRYPSGQIVYESQPIGWIKVLPANSGAPAYILKYMRKQCVVPDGCNKCFTLSSNRGGGIGSMFIRDQREWFFKNPDAVTLDLTDKVCSGRVFHMPITPYVKGLLLGSPSNKIPRKQYDVIREFTKLLAYVKTLEMRLRDCNEHDIYYNVTLGKCTYDSLIDSCKYYTPVVSKAVERLNYMNVTFPPLYHNYTTMLKRHQVLDMFYESVDRLEFLACQILDYPDYNDYFAFVNRIKELRVQAMAKKFAGVSERDIALYVENLDRVNKRSQHKETF